MALAAILNMKRKMTRYQELVSKERALDKILGELVFNAHHIRNTLREIPGMGLDEIHFHRTGENMVEVSIWKYGVTGVRLNPDPVLTDEEEEIQYSAAQAAHEIEKEMRYGLAKPVLKTK